MTEAEINKRLEKYYENVNKKNHIVTVFLTTHKRPYYVSLAIHSVLKQTYKDFYLIVLDNMSEDSTQNVVEGFGDDRLIYLERSSKNNTLTNYEFAFSICKTKYVVIFHDDDIVHEDYLEKMLSILEEHDDYCLLSCSYNVIDENGVIGSDYGFCPQKFNGVVTYKKDEFLIDYYTEKRRDEYILLPTVMYKRDFFKDISKFLDKRAGPSGDNFIYMQAERFGGTLAVLGDVLFDYRKYSGQASSTTASTREMQLMFFLFTQDYYKEKLRAHLYSNYFHGVILSTLVSSIKDYHLHKIDKNKLKAIYAMVPKQLRNHKNNFVIFNFKIATALPKLYYFLFKMIFILKGHRY